MTDYFEIAKQLTLDHCRRMGYRTVGAEEPCTEHPHHEEPQPPRGAVSALDPLGPSSAPTVRVLTLIKGGQA